MPAYGGENIHYMRGYIDGCKEMKAATMTGKFKVESGVALVSEQEFENFRIKIIDECAQVAREMNAPAVAHAILTLKDKKPVSKT